ncbi:EcsC family protein [Siminovitchia fortis]|uniref:EcsC family protein n=1 Tax=Siminovitchia fortis TaxID=254758 RepID=A0A443INC0_9BACI|nr:EcsC family protein [Siminovitchia fortis]RWR07747.1 EcsC family protein [Siminovitchia fortis]WHY82318.1 EcsC family protein [Siminovitchia fortis]
MDWTKRDEQMLEDLQEWRQTLFEYETTDIENAYDKWMEQAFSLLPDSLQIQFFEKLDGWLFHLNSLLRESQLQTDAKERILRTARSMNGDINTLEDLRDYLSIDQLTFLAEQQAARHRLYSFAQGGMTGSGKTLLVGSDLVAMAVINLRAVQLMAMSFGYNVQSPAGLLETLKVFHTATMPDRLKMFGWEDLINDLQKGDEQFYYHEHERITDSSWIDEPLKHLLKASLILKLSRKKVSGLPLASMAIGAGVNYKTTRKITDFTLKYYQYKHLLIKSGEI